MAKALNAINSKTTESQPSDDKVPRVAHILG